ncbi:hypothetical protein [Burkholderia sp. LMG 21824]|uniref:hypothetical protein n=1 Tax=Burkholderia sp. LMG 21824 TaxID=3158172 RepID=UPI003C30EA69
MRTCAAGGEGGLRCRATCIQTISLVEQGADVAVADAYGARRSTFALAVVAHGGVHYARARHTSAPPACPAAVC